MQAVTSTVAQASLPRTAAASRVARPRLTPALLSPRPAAARPAQHSLVVRAQKPSTGGGPGFKTAASPAEPAFTRRREHFAGRVAALGFAFSLAGELITGLGPVGQLHLETGLPYPAIYLALLGFIGQGVWSLRPDGPTRSRENQEDVYKREPVSALKNPRKWLVRNEAVIGRLAMAGFLGAVVLELAYGGQAPLGYLGLIPTGITNLSQAPWWIVTLVIVFAFTGLGAFENLIGEEDVDAL